MAHIIVHEPDQEVAAVPLRDGFRAGRHLQNDLVLGYQDVSREHVKFSRSPKGWWAKNLSATKGTLVNGERIDTHRLYDGDRIKVGNVELTFQEAERPLEIVHQQVTEIGPPSRDVGTHGRLRLVYEMSRAVGALEDADTILERMLPAILEELGCERAMAGLANDEGSGFRFVTRVRGALREDVVVSRTIVETMTNRRQSIILCNDGGHNVPQTLVRQGILSAMGVPLQAGSRLFGFLYVDDRTRVDRFSSQDLELLMALGHLMAVALSNADRFRQVAAVAEAFKAEIPTVKLIGESAPMQQLKDQITRYGAAPGTNVLIRGESGTGKELVARTLHAVSPRADRAFVPLNCAAIHETLIESELFGHVKGAFTGANQSKRGRFELADRGTLFLDEIGDLHLGAQAKLLRAIQEGEIQPVGSEKTLRVNVRILSATNKDLQKEINEKRFRADLYYRISAGEIDTPPLRERGDDINLLVQALLPSVASSTGKRLQGFTQAALAALRWHHWPGNVRELRNEMERAALNTNSPIVDVSDLSPNLRSAAKGQPEPAPSATLGERYCGLELTERRLVAEALHQAGGNLSGAARLLGITRIMIERRVKRFGLSSRDD